jgi:shikimate dehydrogenase
VLITAETRLVGLIGHPLSHSLSPRMQNAAFAARALDWTYVALPVEPARLEAAVGGLSALGFAGANVTIPHKTAVLAFCDELDGVAERAGSVNTLVVEDGRLLGSSTDGAAVVGQVDARDAHALVLGAGGAAQAVATALVEAGCASLRIAARRAGHAHALAARLAALFPERETAADDAWPPTAREATLIVNATPLRDEVVVEAQPGMQVVDLTYNADGRPTALVAAARERGCETVDGLAVLVAQGAASFERWTGVPAPLAVMRAAIRG